MRRNFLSPILIGSERFFYHIILLLLLYHSPAPTFIVTIVSPKYDIKGEKYVTIHGLLRKSFIPDEVTKELRHLVRQRDNIIRYAAR